MVTKSVTAKAVAPKRAAKVSSNPVVAVAPKRGQFSGSAVITLTTVNPVNPNRPGGAAGNPKLPSTGGWLLYTAYGKGPITVDNYLKAVGKLDWSTIAGPARPKAGRSAIAWDLAHGYITVKG